jgi:hypothetical protein
MRFLWNHDKITYSSRVEVDNPDSSTRWAYPVTYDGHAAGYVARAENHADGWAYLPAGREGSPWITGFETRADAADNLLSYQSPIAGWLV